MITKEKNKIVINNKKGITLVSLVITIVIMLILAGVTISFIIGKNGLFNKTQASANAYSKEAVKEELQMASNTVYIDDTDTNITNVMIANSMQNELKTIDWLNKDELAGTYKGYDFYLDESHNVIMEKKDVKPYIPDMNMLNTNNKDIRNATAYSMYRTQINSVTFDIDSDLTKYNESNIINDKNPWVISTNPDDQTIVAFFEDSGNTSVPYNLKIIGKDKMILPVDSSAFFSNFENVSSITGFDKLDYSKVENMSFFFYYFGINNLASLDLTEFDTSNVTNMNHMFNYCGQNNLSLFNIGNKFDTSKVTDMAYMFNLFYMHGNIPTLDLGGNFDTSNVTNMNNMFNGCGYDLLTKINFGDKFNTSNVTNMSGMFYSLGFKKMTTFTLPSTFNTSKVTNMNSMFYWCGKESMTTLNLNSSFNTSNVENMAYMFMCCGQDKLLSLDLSKCNFNTSKVTNMNDMFYQCGMSSMQTLNLGSNFNTKEVTNFGAMFAYTGQNALTSLALGNSFDTSKATTMERLFYDCGMNTMTSLNLGTAFKIPSGVDTTNSFTNTGLSTCTISCPSAYSQTVYNLTGPQKRTMVKL